MRERKVKVAIIGAGTAGLSAFKEAQKVTPDCVLINGGPDGTTCARVGCMPSKLLIQVARDFYRRHTFEEQGIKNSRELRLDKAAVMRYVRTWRDYFVSGVLKSVERLGDKKMEGYARFREPQVLDVEGVRVIADASVIATGSAPIVPEEWRQYGGRLLTTDDLFEQETLNDSMAVIGAGVIGLELGLALSRLGVAVTMAEGAAFIGGLSDPLVNEYAIGLVREEVDLHLGHPARLSRQSDQLEFSCGPDRCLIEGALVAIGRRPQIANLGLADIGVALNEHGLPEFDAATMRLKGLPIFMAGDADGFRPVLHEAADEGRIAGYNAARDNPRCFQRRTSLSIAFTEPQIVIAGRHYRDLAGKPHIIGEAGFDNQGRSRIMHQNKGLLRIYAEPHCGRLLGAEMMAPDGEYIGHLLAWAIQKRLTVFDVLNMPFYHPTVLEGLRTAIRDLASQVTGPAPELELAPCGGLPAGCLD